MEIRAMRTVVIKFDSLLILLALILSISYRPLTAQTTLVTQSTKVELNPTCGAGAVDPADWRRVPATLNAHPDTVSAEVRKARNDNWVTATLPNQDVVLDPATGIYAGTMETAQNPWPYNARIYWVVGTFISYDVYEVSDKVIYTEVHLRIDRILGTHEKPNTPKVGAVVDVDFVGGCIKTPSGEVYDFQPHSYEGMIRPSHRYIMELGRNRTIDMYGSWTFIADMTSGIAQPVAMYAVSAASHGRWPYSGLNEDVAIKLVEETVAKNN